MALTLSLRAMSVAEMSLAAGDLRESLEARLSRLDGRGAVAARSLRTGEELLIEPDAEMPSASLIKMPIAMALQEDVAGGRVSWDEVLGCEGHAVDHLAYEMIRISDNEATNLLTQRIGMDRINRFMETKGLRGTRMRRLMLDWEARQRGDENVTTARDMLWVLGDVARGGDLDPLRRAMLDQYYRTRIPAVVPGECVIANKTGELDDVVHDAAILYTPFGTVLAVIMLSELTSVADGEETCRVVAGEVYAHFARGALHLSGDLGPVVVEGGDGPCETPCTIWVGPSVQQPVTCRVRVPGVSLTASVDLRPGDRLALSGR
jgi:beta-lactamase class A